MNKKKKVTIYDIARISGFSPKTVSRVVNGEKNVKKSTYEKINQILQEYNYVPNTYARGLINKTNRNILISVPKTEFYPLEWFHILLEKIILECRKHDMNTIVEYTEPNDSMENSVLYSSSSFIGAAVIFYESPMDQRIIYLQKLGIPFIVFGKSDTEGVTYVTNNDYDALKSLMYYLVSKGLEKVSLLIGDQSLVNMDRVQGVKDAYGELGLDASLIEVVYQMKTVEDVYLYTKAGFTKENIPDAIFVSGDEKVIGLIRALNELNIKIPADVSIVGFDNIPWAQYFDPSLTTIAQDFTTLSKEIVNRLESLINGMTDLTSIEVPTKLIIRETTK
ncbi:LacI family DNA-binding transcriptional regulator [Bacillus sp. SD088]|uniref:LacI family DNA-binding transcriptional regulator n=1 Tax=Bacillus sp. SD088 TaxID=2782012 RepID=UPI001A956409|nr:LacI family DNA-binding transcriptional regulator [Bacillus sp. SD088]MBO0991828.1 LacI family DNA-binding transcriptional regulator [Bacillus sp. SD088]